MSDDLTIAGNDISEEDDEFYECKEEIEEDERGNGSRSVWDKPEGRLKHCAQLRLLETTEALYIPITQEPAPMTEDRLEEHAGVLLQLGTDTVGSQLRARMMSASLLSDMESFKVLMNVNCISKGHLFIIKSVHLYHNEDGKFDSQYLRMFTKFIHLRQMIPYIVECKVK